MDSLVTTLLFWLGSCLKKHYFTLQFSSSFFLCTTKLLQVSPSAFLIKLMMRLLSFENS